RRDGARVALQQGTASLRVVHRQRTRWAVDAGPFVVEVTGTSFDVRWSTRDEAFDLTLREGSVIVRGPLTGDGVRLAAGQRMRVRVAVGELRVEALPPTGANEAAGSGAPSAVAAPAAEATGERVATTPEHGERSGLAWNAADPLRQTWTKRVSAGDYAAVVA